MSRKVHGAVVPLSCLHAPCVSAGLPRLHVHPPTFLHAQAVQRLLRSRGSYFTPQFNTTLFLNSMSTWPTAAVARLYRQGQVSKSSLGGETETCCPLIAQI